MTLHLLGGRLSDVAGHLDGFDILTIFDVHLVAHGGLVLQWCHELITPSAGRGAICITV